MIYIKTFEDFVPIKNSEPLQQHKTKKFEPIKHNLQKPFKPKKNIDKAIKYFNKRINSLHERIPNELDIKKRSDMNKLVNQQVKDLSELKFKKVKQLIHLSGNTIQESVNYEPEVGDYIVCDANIDNLKYSDPKYNKVIDFVSNNIGIYQGKIEIYIFNYIITNYIVKYENYPENLKEFFDKSHKNDRFKYKGKSFNYNDLLFWSKDKKQAEEFLKIREEKEEYNL